MPEDASADAQDRADTTLGGSALGGIQHPGEWGDRGTTTPANSLGSSVSTRRTPRPGQWLLLEEGTRCSLVFVLAGTERGLRGTSQDKGAG